MKYTITCWKKTNIGSTNYEIDVNSLNDARKQACHLMKNPSKFKTLGQIGLDFGLRGDLYIIKISKDRKITGYVIFCPEISKHNMWAKITEKSFEGLGFIKANGEITKKIP